MFATSPALAAIPRIAHAFCTPAPEGDRGWARAAGLAGMAGAPVARARQVHGDGVRRASEGGDQGEADAVFTDAPGLMVAVVTADCVPVLIAGAGVVAAVHAGWRGLAGGVLPATMARLAGRGPFTAAIGPCIRSAAYETGDEVVHRLIEAGVPRGVVHVTPRGGGPAHADLAAAARWILRDQGCAVVDDVEVCTWSDRRYESYRRDGAASRRQISLIGLQP